MKARHTWNDVDVDMTKGALIRKVSTCPRCGLVRISLNYRSGWLSKYVYMGRVTTKMPGCVPVVEQLKLF